MSAMLDAALALAARGWKIFPCNPKTKRPLVASETEGEGGVHLASSDRAQIAAWWERWPKAMIGLPMGAFEPRSKLTGLFAVDFDAGTDEKTGEIFALDDLVAALEKEIGCRLPETWCASTPRGGRHLYFKLPTFASDDVDERGERYTIKNRAGIVPRVDIRGEGGYVIAPPSERPDGKGYAWIVKPFDHSPDLGLAAAPSALLDLVLRRGRWGRNVVPISERAKAAKAPRKSSSTADKHRRYALAALDGEVRNVKEAAPGTHNQTLAGASLKMGHLVGAGILDEATAYGALYAAATPRAPHKEADDVIRRGLRDGAAEPTDLATIGARSARSPRPEPYDHAPDETADPPIPLRLKDPNSADALRDLARQNRRRPDPPPLKPRGGKLAGQWKPDWLGMPKEDPCPVTPLGKSGGKYYFLDTARELRPSTKNDLNHAGIQDLFADYPNWPKWAFPRFGKAKKDASGEVIEIPIESFKDDEVRDALFRACSRKGLFSIEQKVRGRGMHRRHDGSLIYHAGEELWVFEDGNIRALECGEHVEGNEYFIYPRAEKLDPPWWQDIPDDQNPARALIEGFRGWNWLDKETMPVLLLGWLGIAYLAGALDWRSVAVVVGDAGTGKSTLLKFIHDVFGKALFKSSDTTKAGIYQHTKQDTRPIAIDEIEGKSDNAKSMDVIELARVAASGDTGHRGSSDGNAIEFEMKSAFIFSAINMPPLMPQDLSRMALLRLKEIENVEKKTPPTIDPETCGRKVLARLLRQQQYLDETLAKYKATMALAGHDKRGSDTYGTLLACADLMLGPTLAEELGIPMGERSGEWAKLLHVSKLPEVQAREKNWEKARNTLLRAIVPAWRNGMRNTVGQLIDDLYLDKIERDQAKRELAQTGLGLVRLTQSNLWAVAVPPNSRAVQQLFFDTAFVGAGGVGNWTNALRDGPKDQIITDASVNRVRINGVQERCVLVVCSDPRTKEGGTDNGDRNFSVSAPAPDGGTGGSA